MDSRIGRESRCPYNGFEAPFDESIKAEQKKKDAFNEGTRLVHGGQEWSLMWAESKWYARSIRGKHHEHMKYQVKERHKERMVQKMVT